jgi:hypothetical protein
LIRSHLAKHDRPSWAVLVAPVPCDADGEIRNGYANFPYLPKDPGRRERLLTALGYLKEKQ